MDEFGNHASYCMMSLGNELWGSKERMAEIITNYRKVDDRHLYTQGSNNFQHTPVLLPEDDFFVGVRFSKNRLFRGSYGMCDAPLGHIQWDEPSADHNYNEVIHPTNAAADAGNDAEEIEIQYGTGVKKVKAADNGGVLIPHIPVVSHEIGQFAVYPNFREIDKYTGVLKARNFEVFRDRLKEKGMLDQADDFFYTSGKLSVQCYKEELEAAAQHCDINDLVIDEDAKTVYLSDPEMSLDVGSVGKGYAVEMVCRAAEARGLTSALVSVGGNLRAIGTKPDGSQWTGGVEDPWNASEVYTSTNSIFGSPINMSDLALVTSGDYQRYFVVDGKRYHHIIDPVTLMPLNNFASVSILCNDSGKADALSTALFNMTIGDGKSLLANIGGIEAIWVHPDGSYECTDGFSELIID